MYATYTLKKEELNSEFIENIKKMITTDEILLSVESYDETEYLMKSPRNREILLERIKYHALILIELIIFGLVLNLPV